MPDANLQIRMDPLNPGQFFACCGMFELLSMQEPGLLGWFVAEPKQPRLASFCIQSSRGTDALGSVLREFRASKVEFVDQGVDAPVRPAIVTLGTRELHIDWWLDEFRDKTTNIKCWAGQVTTRRLFDELVPLLDSDSDGEHLFGRPALTSSLFGVDPRSAWNTLDLGFSPNEHKVPSTVFPAVELLAAIGLQYFRPDSGRRSLVPYSLWMEPLPASIARLAFCAPWDGLPVVSLAFEIRKRGQSYKYFSFGWKRES